MKRTNYQLKDYFIEFFIVLLGITIAFWLSNLGEEKKERQLEEVYLTDIANDLDKDIEDLTFAIYQNNKKYDKLIQGYKYYLEGGPKVSADSLVCYAQLIGNYFHFQPNNYTYISLQQSGDFKIIKDPGLKKSLIELYKLYELISLEQANVMDALDRNYFPVLMAKYDMITGKVFDESYFESPDFKNTLAFNLNEINTMLKFFGDAVKHIERLKSDHLN